MGRAAFERFGVKPRVEYLYLSHLRAVALPGFVARRDKDLNYVMRHSQWTTGELLND